MTSDAYFRTHEYMFVFAKGKLKTANLLHDKPNVRPGAKKERKSTGRTGDSPIKFIPSGGGVLADTGKRGSVWRYRTLKQDNEPNVSLAANSLPTRPVSRGSLPATTS